MYPGRTRYGGVLALAVSGRSDRSRPRRSPRCGGELAARRRGVRGTSAGGDAEAAARSTFPAFAAGAGTGGRPHPRGGPPGQGGRAGAGGGRAGGGEKASPPLVGVGRG